MPHNNLGLSVARHDRHQEAIAWAPLKKRRRSARYVERTSTKPLARLALIWRRFRRSGWKRLSNITGRAALTPIFFQTSAPRPPRPLLARRIGNIEARPSFCTGLAELGPIRLHFSRYVPHVAPGGGPRPRSHPGGAARPLAPLLMLATGGRIRVAPLRQGDAIPPQ